MRKTVGIICGLSMYSSLFAQQNTADLTDISATEKRVTVLEKITSALPTISGFVNMRYQYDGESNSFDIRRAQLDLKGNLAAKLDYRFQDDNKSKDFSERCNFSPCSDEIKIYRL